MPSSHLKKRSKRPHLQHRGNAAAMQRGTVNTVVQGRRASKGWSVGGFGSHDCAVQLVGLAKYNELDDLTVEGAMLLAASSMACGVSSQGVSEGSQLVFIE